MIFISAGHHFNPEGADPGAIANGFKEADLTRELRDLITTELTRLNASFITDRDSETLSQYINRIKPGSGSVLCDIHFNASTNFNATGIEVLVKRDANSNSKELALKICQAGGVACGFYNRGVKSEADSHRGRLAVLNTGAGISVLPEICFLTNKEDVIRYNKFKGQLAIRIAKLLKEFDDRAT